MKNKIEILNAVFIAVVLSDCTIDASKNGALPNLPQASPPSQPPTQVIVQPSPTPPSDAGSSTSFSPFDAAAMMVPVVSGEGGTAGASDPGFPSLSGSGGDMSRAAPATGGVGGSGGTGTAGSGGKMSSEDAGADVPPPPPIKQELVQSIPFGWVTPPTAPWVTEIGMGYDVYSGLRNDTAAPIIVKKATIAGRMPGSTHAGGPYTDFLPYQDVPVTLQPGDSLPLAAGRIFQEDEAPGSWEVYLTWQDENDMWHDLLGIQLDVKPLIFREVIVDYVPQPDDPNISLSTFSYSPGPSGHRSLFLGGVGAPGQEFNVTLSTSCPFPFVDREGVRGVHILVSPQGTWSATIDNYYDFRNQAISFRHTASYPSAGDGPCKYTGAVLFVPKN